LAAAVAAAVPGTVVSEVARTLPGVATRIGHALGTLAVGAEVSCHAGAAGAVRWRVDRCVLSRGARRLMTGILHVPSAA
jgi:2-methylaconitate cis-trans-isomerase PrpF